MLLPFPCPGFLYPLKVPHRTRARDKPMKILALGLSRTGTDSLRIALGMLGFENVYHGFAVVEQEVWTDGRAWYNLLDRKFKKDDKSISNEDFDIVLGNWSAVSDVPAVLFANELLDAYPQAMVILNKRLSVAEWKESFRNTTLAAEQSLVMRLLSYFNIEMFWLQRTFEAVIFTLFHGHFDSNAEAVYSKHCQEIQAKLDANGRPYLEWHVQDGWEPLCRFLKKEVPKIDFPTGNAKQDHDERISQLVSQRVLAATVTAFVVGLGILSMALALWFKTQ